MPRAVRTLASSALLGLLLAWGLGLVVGTAWADDLPAPRHQAGAAGPGAPPAPAPAPAPAPSPAAAPPPAPMPAPAPASPAPAPRPGANPAPVPGPAPAARPVSGPLPPARPGPGPVVAAGPAGEGPVIVRIEFSGNAIYATESMKLKMRLKEGRRLDPALLDADTSMLYQFFQEVRVEQTEVPGGVVLRFVVTENPIVRELVINGLEEMKEEEVIGLPMRTRVGFPLVERNLDLDREDIANAYRRRGFYFADVSVAPPVTIAGSGRRVVFTVVEGPKVKVEDIVLSGNANVLRRDILEVMLTKPSGLFDTKTFNEETLREDLVEIRRLYRGEGYLDAEVVLEDLRFSDDKSKVVVVISIDEGLRYEVGEVTFDVKRETSGPGTPPPEDVAFFSTDRLRTMLGLVPGQVYSGKTEDKGREKIKEEYFRRSYLEARIEQAELRPRAGGRVVDLRVPVYEGRKYRVGRVAIVGNEFTRDKIVRREILAAPGDYVDRNALDRGLTRVRATRFFERVSRRFEDVPGPDGKPVEDLKDVVYEVVEGKTGKLTVGVALATGGGLSGNFQFQKRNFDIARLPTSWNDITSGRAFTGAGQTFNAYVQPGTVTSAFGLDFGEPRVFGSKFSMKVGGSKRIAFREDYTEDFLGYYVRVGHPVYESADDRWGIEASLTWRHENVGIKDVGDDAVPGVYLFEGDNELRSLALGLTMRYVDDPVRPTWRMSNALIFESVGGWVGGDLDYWKLTFNHDQNWKLHEDDKGRRQTLALGVSGGVGSAYDDTPEIPPYARFFVGGRGTLRGFETRGVGEHASGKPMGGEFYLVGSLEYQYPFVEDFLSAVAFTDWGTIGTEMFSDDSWQPRGSIGLGLRLKIPMLGDAPLALDFAYPIVRQDEDDIQYLSFSLARDF